MSFEVLDELVRDREDAARGGGALPETIGRAEEALGVRFPKGLREYLARFGWLRVGHREFFGLGLDVPSYLDLVRMTQSERGEVGSPIPPDLIPVLNDGGGNHYCVSIPDGRVVLWDHSLGEDQTPEPCSSDFEAWLLEKCLNDSVYTLARRG